MFWIFGAQSEAHRMAAAMPVADITGSNPGPTLLVTAGLDGDEYIGIEAAYRAAEIHKEGNFSGRLVILPLVNIAGFEAGVSYNPIDGAYPKYSIPGNSFGSPTQRLMHHIARTYAREATLWLDLHSGATGEVVIPHLWNSLTGIKDVDALSTAYSENSGTDVVVREQASADIKKLGNQGCAYVLAETEDVEQHEEYIARAMEQLGMIPNQLPSPRLPRIFRKSIAITANNRDSLSSVKDSIVLWHTRGVPATKSGRIGEIAYDEVKM